MCLVEQEDKIYNKNKHASLIFWGASSYNNISFFLSKREYMFVSKEKDKTQKLEKETLRSTKEHSISD